MTAATQKKGGYAGYRLVGEPGQTQFITVFVHGAPPRAMSSGQPEFDAVLEKARAGDPTVIDLLDMAAAAQSKFQYLTDRIVARADGIYFDGDKMVGPLADQVSRFLREGVGDWRPLVNFFERVMTNTNEHTRRTLFDFLGQEDFTINDDGTIVGYKAVHVRGDAYSPSRFGPGVTVNGVLQVGRIEQRVGDLVEMPRARVVHDPTADCSVGLHVGTHNYASTFLTGPGTAVLEVAIDPRDVVSVPEGRGGYGKVRVCRYRVVREIPKRAKVTAAVKKAGRPNARKGAATVASKIAGVLKRRKKNGLDAKAIADKTGVSLATTRTTLSRMKKDGSVKVAGKKKGKADTYVAA